MRSLQERIIDVALSGITILGLAAIFSDGAFGQNSECTTGACNNVQYYYSCDANGGLYTKYLDCIACGTGKTRCKNLGGTCTEQTLNQEIAQLSVTGVCACADGLNRVEATSNATTDTTPTGTKQYLCKST